MSSFISTSPDSIEILKRNKLINVIVLLIEAEISNLKTEIHHDKQQILNEFILELIEMLKNV